MLSAGGRDACGLGELGVGTGYVFFATGTETPYAADACGGTGVANPTKVDKVEKLLGAGTAVEPPPPPTAQLTKVEDAAPAGFARAAAPGAAAVLVGLLGLLVVRRLARALTSPGLAVGQRYMPLAGPPDSSCGCSRRACSACRPAALAAAGRPGPIGRARRICSSWAREAICWA